MLNGIERLSRNTITYFGTKLRERRKQLGWSLVRAATEMRLSNYQTIQSWENGRTFPSLGYLPLLEDALDINVIELLRESLKEASRQQQEQRPRS